MRKFTLAEFAQLAEIVAAVAVILSLVYVGVQVKANTAAVRSASIQAITNTSAEGLRAQNADPDLSRIRRLGDADPSTLTADESYRYNTLYRQIWLTFHNVYLQRDLEIIGVGLWSTYERIICIDLLQPGVVATWRKHASVLDPEFVATVEACPRFSELNQ